MFSLYKVQRLWRLQALGDERNFAFLKVQDGGKAAPCDVRLGFSSTFGLKRALFGAFSASKSWISVGELRPDAVWMFFDGKEAGWQQARHLEKQF